MGCDGSKESMKPAQDAENQGDNAGQATGNGHVETEAQQPSKTAAADDNTQ